MIKIDYKCDTCHSFRPTVCAVCKEHVNLIYVTYSDSKLGRDEILNYLTKLIKYYFDYKDGRKMKTSEETMYQCELLGKYMEELKKNKADGLFIAEDYEVD